jgi:hypothetical protein
LTALNQLLKPLLLKNSALKEILPLKLDAEQRPKKEVSQPMSTMVTVPTKHLLELGTQTVASFTYRHTMTVGTMEKLTSEQVEMQRRNSMISASMTST